MSEQEKQFHEFCEDAKGIIEKQLSRMWAFVKWFSGISLAIIVTLIFAIAELRGNDQKQAEQIKKINDNYLPYEIMSAIMENNDRFIEVVNSIPEALKSDKKYQEALKNRNDFQRDILLKIALKNRSAEK